MQEPFTIYLRAKEPELLLSNRYKEEADKRIEIIPEKSSAFDFISIIDFINAVHFDFYAIPMIRKRDKSSYIEFYRNEIKSPIRLPILYSFIVEFGKDFSYIKVFIKNYMHDFEYINKNETLCIRLTNKIQLNQFSYQVFQSFIRPNTIIYEIAKYFTGKIS